MKMDDNSPFLFQRIFDIPANCSPFLDFETEILNLQQRQKIIENLEKGEIPVEDLLDLLDQQKFDIGSYLNLVDARLDSLFRTGNFTDLVDWHEF